MNGYLAAKFVEKGNGFLKRATDEENHKAHQLREVGQRMRELINEEKRVRAVYKDAEIDLHEVEKELRWVREENDELCAYFRNAIGADYGIETEEGVISWSSDSRGTRVLRKKWKK